MKRFRSSWWCMRWLLACVTSVIEDNYNGDWEHGQKRLLYLSEGNIFLRIRLKHEEGHADKEKLWKELKKRAESREERQKVTLNGDGAENQTVFFSELRTWTVVTARKHPSEEMKHRSGRFGQRSRTHFELWQQAFFFPPWMKKKISVNVPVLHREQASENMFLGEDQLPQGMTAYLTEEDIFQRHFHLIYTPSAPFCSVSAHSYDSRYWDYQGFFEEIHRGLSAELAIFGQLHISAQCAAFIKTPGTHG